MLTRPLFLALLLLLDSSEDIEGLLRAVCLLCKIPLLTSQCTVVLSTVDQGIVRQGIESRLALSTVDKAGVSGLVFPTRHWMLGDKLLAIPHPC